MQSTLSYQEVKRPKTFVLHDYQIVARDFVFNQLYRRPGAGLWIDLGLGKTAITLHAIELLALDGVRKTLVIAPKRVVPGWLDEVEKWGVPLKVVSVTGTEKQRLKALASPADVYVATRDSTPWLEKQKWKFDLLVIDEITAFKNWTAKRTKSLRRMLLRLPKRIGLTGTPVPNSMADIFPQHFMLDTGQTLGARITEFRKQFCYRGGYENREWIFDDTKRGVLEDLIAPWYLRQSALDHLDLPARVENEIRVEMPPAAKKIYKSMQEQMFAEIDSTPLVAFSGGGKYNLCRQIASGAAYDESGEAVAVHDAKLEALEDLVDELNGKNLMVAYSFTHELNRIKERFPKAAVINGDTKDKEFLKIKADWKAGKIQMLVCQCQSMSHGVDGLQHSCSDVCWFSLTDQPEVRNQLEARIWRQGTTAQQVRIHYLIATGTVDVAIKRGLDAKNATQQDVLRAIKEYRNAT